MEVKAVRKRLSEKRSAVRFHHVVSIILSNLLSRNNLIVEIIMKARYIRFNKFLKSPIGNRIFRVGSFASSIDLDDWKII